MIAVHKRAVDEVDVFKASNCGRKKTCSLQWEESCPTIVDVLETGDFFAIGLPVDKVDVLHRKRFVSDLNSQNVSSIFGERCAPSSSLIREDGGTIGGNDGRVTVVNISKIFGFFDEN